MKKFTNLFCIIFIFTGLKANAQNYLISFAGSGATTEVSGVKVENLTKGTSLTLNGNDILRLTFTTGVNSIDNGQTSKLKIYPNPMVDFSTVEIFPPVEGDAVISIYEITGKPVFQIESYMENLRQGFRLSGLKNGFYIVNVKGINYQFSGKIVSNGKSNGTINIEKIYYIIQESNERTEKTEQANPKSVLSTVDMEYTHGEELKFTGFSGNNSTVVTDVPISDKTITFLFAPCSDVDNNHYPILEIGSQVWMVENLKTTKYNDGIAIPKVTDAESWSYMRTPAYSWYNNDSINNKEISGALYNWYTVNTKKLCPEGWHVPTYDEWVTLTNYLIDNGFGYEGSGIDIGKSMASQSGWALDPTPGNVGNDQGSNNSSGFTAFPSGVRYYSGSFTYSGFGISWWSSTEAGTDLGWVWGLEYDLNSDFGDPSRTQAGFSVRCLKN